LTDTRNHSGRPTVENRTKGGKGNEGEWRLPKKKRGNQATRREGGRIRGHGGERDNVGLEGSFAKMLSSHSRRSFGRKEGALDAVKKKSTTIIKKRKRRSSLKGQKKSRFDIIEKFSTQKRNVTPPPVRGFLQTGRRLPKSRTNEY